MTRKKLVALLLCASLLLSILFACNTPEVVDEVDVEDEQVDAVPDIEPPKEGIDFDAAIATFPPDTVMITAGELKFTWAELYVLLFSSVQEVLQISPFGIDWSGEISHGITLEDYALMRATEEALNLMLFEYGAKDLGVTLSEELQIKHNQEIDALIENYGGIDELSKVLWENGGFYSFDVFERLVLLEYTSAYILIDLYGESGDALPEEDVADFVERYGFMMAKHIVILSEDNDSAREEAEDILKQLKSKVNDDDFEEFFDSLMFELTEDPGVVMSPEGYLFQFNDMVEPFSEACQALEIGQMSELVETEYGFHILLRLPIDYDSVPISAVQAGMIRNLWQLAAIENFEMLVQKWREEFNPVFTPEYDSIDIATIFHWWER